MIDGLPIEFAHARIGARLGQRPDERLWQHLNAARGVPALLDAMRASPAAGYVTGVAVPGEADQIDLAFRLQLRARIAEAAAWSPEDWRSAVAWTRHLVDLPALVHLLGTQPPPRWVGDDPTLAPFALPDHAERVDALRSSPLAPIVEAMLHPPAEAALRAVARARRSPSLHLALQAWRSHWHGLWPAPRRGSADALEQLIDIVERHWRRFGGLHLDDAQAARDALALRVKALLRQHPAQPATLFAYLVVVALDLERLRGAFLAAAVAGHWHR
jgi:hypothetical protein